MAKKKPLKKAPTPSAKAKKIVVKKVSAKKKPIVKKVSPKKSPIKKAYKGKKRGRKPSSPNRYNLIKSAISQSYKDSAKRSIKRYELKIIYEWIVSEYGTQSLKYIVMNIDIIIDNFWKEYCNLYPIDKNNFALFFEWFNFKTYLSDEQKYHHETDIIQVDLNAIGQGVMEFMYDRYPSKSEEYYEICKAEGIKRESPPPALYLEDAFCDIAKKGNVFRYKLMLESDMPIRENGNGSGDNNSGLSTASNNSNIGNNSSNNNNINNSNNTISETPPIINPNLENNTTNNGISTNNEFELGKERIKQEYALKETKLKELAQLLKDKVITFDDYMKAIKMV